MKILCRLGFHKYRWVMNMASGKYWCELHECARCGKKKIKKEQK